MSVSSSGTLDPYVKYWLEKPARSQQIRFVIFWQAMWSQSFHVFFFIYLGFTALLFHSPIVARFPARQRYISGNMKTLLLSS